MLEEAALGLDTRDQLGIILVKHDSGWDAYSNTLQIKTNGNYRSIQLVASYDETNRAIAAQDRQTGLYGLVLTCLRSSIPPSFISAIWMNTLKRAVQNQSYRPIGRMARRTSTA